MAEARRPAVQPALERCARQGARAGAGRCAPYPCGRGPRAASTAPGGCPACAPGRALPDPALYPDVERAKAVATGPEDCGRPEARRATRPRSSVWSPGPVREVLAHRGAEDARRTGPSHPGSGASWSSRSRASPPVPGTRRCPRPRAGRCRHRRSEDQRADPHLIAGSRNVDGRRREGRIQPPDRRPGGVGGRNGCRSQVTDLVPIRRGVHERDRHRAVEDLELSPRHGGSASGPIARGGRRPRLSEDARRRGPAHPRWRAWP